MIPYMHDLGHKFEATKLSRRTVQIRYLLYYKIYNWNERDGAVLACSLVSRNWPIADYISYRLCEDKYIEKYYLWKQRCWSP